MIGNRRDRILVSIAVLLVVGTAVLVGATVLRAQGDGREALEKLQIAQVEQLARSFDSRVTASFSSFEGLATAPPPWSAKLRDPGDQARLDQLQALISNARTGLMIVDRNSVVTAATLLRDPTLVGRRFERAGLPAVLAGTPAFLPVAPGVTTALPAVAIAYPLRDSTQTVIGAFVVESDVSTQSAFQQEVAQLRSGRTGHFSFLDSNGVAVASSNPSLLGKKLDDPLLRIEGAGLRRGNGRILITRPVPAAGWVTVFQQDIDEFEGALTGPLRNAVLFVGLAGTVAAIVSFFALARRLRRAREEQRRLEDLNATREEFISIVSHELRTPVAGLMGFLQTTLDHWEVMEDDERRRAMSRGLASARRLHSLTRDVLDTSSMDAGGMHFTFSLIDLRDEVAAAVTAAHDIAPDRTFQVTVPDAPAWVRADRDRVQQVLTNLIDNALKSSPPLAPVEISLAVQDEVATLTVRDHGAGLSPDEIGKVFDKFVRGRTSAPSGTGLGLYICRQIVEAHGGMIEATNADTGALFSFELPLLSAPAEPISV